MTKDELIYLGSWKGRVVKAIAIDSAKTWSEIRDSTGLSPKKLNLVLRELYNAEAIEKIKDKDEYKVKYHLYLKYKEYFEKLHDDARIAPKVKILEKIQKEFKPWIDSWADLNELKIDLSNNHFYLEGRDLNFFSQEIIRKARNEVLVANPFVNDCNLSETMREAVGNKATATLIRRPPDSEKNMKFNDILQREGINIYFNNKVHAKTIVVDRTVAIVS